MRSRKSTATLTLVLIGAALHGCGDDNQTARRDVYRTQADCKRDWGEDASKCERQSSGPHSGYYYGPSYGYGRSTSTVGSNLSPRSGSSAMSSTTVSRGGFGASASSHSSGG
ncbi:MAG TPA: hypothetical protein VHP37_24275 [Burkholderiales bacterium]|nr:hypothetical protein [Burkholderiales bacterium]